MAAIDPDLARQFAVDVVHRLREAGHQALWAGGCVRDQLLGAKPKDYDVATDAEPDRVRDIFGKGRTLAIGASFGVISVLGPKGAGQIDVATFRRDAAYSDGRHPDAVTFSDARHDAQRRDFTINGLFFDPLAEQVIDYVGGQEDLARGVVRAIGDPAQRIAEDKLRMLRAVRFAARLNFAIDAATLAAIREQASELVIVSAERIAAEMRLILTHGNRSRGLELLAEAELLPVVLPEGKYLPTDPAAWRETLAVLKNLERPRFAMALAALLRNLHQADSAQDIASQVAARWKLSTDEVTGTEKLLREEELIRTARRQPWPKLQRVLAAPRAEELVAYAEAVVRALGEDAADIAFCRKKVSLPPEELDPPPLVTGDDLKPLGIPPGPIYRELLDRIRDAQLAGRIASRADALALATELSRRQR